MHDRQIFGSLFFVDGGRVKSGRKRPTLADLDPPYNPFRPFWHIPHVVNTFDIVLKTREVKNPLRLRYNCSIVNAPLGPEESLRDIHT